MSVKHELQNIISGNAEVSHGKTIQAITGYLRGKKAASSEPEEPKYLRQKEEQALKKYLYAKALWSEKPDIIKLNQTPFNFLVSTFPVSKKNAYMFFAYKSVSGF